jgi:hypothetical protein
MWFGRFRLPLVPLLAVCGALRAAAQSGIELDFRAAEAYTNESIPFTVSIFNYRRAEKPTIPEIPNCEITGGNSQTEMTLDSRRGSSRNWVRYSYDFVAFKPGDYTIPPIEVVVDGKVLKTDPRKLTVLPGEVSDSVQAEITASTQRLFIGQQVTVTLTIYIKPAMVGRQAADRSTMKRFLDTSWGNYANFRDTGRGGSVRRPDSQGNQTEFHAYEFIDQLVLDQAGPLPFADIVVGVDYPKFARDRLGGVSIEKYRKLRIHPACELPDVRPLPSEGRPANFTGAVGVFRIDASAKPTRVRVGDPIELALSLTGSGALDALPPPNLAAQASLVEVFRVPDEALAGRMENGRRIFSQAIRAKRGDVDFIPPIEYAYFDADRGEYAIARSAPIPITVEASNALDVSALPELAVPSNTTPLTPEAIDGLRGNRVDEGELLRTVRPLKMSQVAAVVLAPPAFFAIGCAWSALARARHGGVARQRRQHALANALKRVEAARARPLRELPGELAAAMAAYLADRFDAPAGRYVGAAGVDALRERNAPETLRARCLDLLARCENAVYAGGEGDAALADETRECLMQLERERL